MLAIMSVLPCFILSFQAEEALSKLYITCLVSLLPVSPSPLLRFVFLEHLKTSTKPGLTLFFGVSPVVEGTAALFCRTKSDLAVTVREDISENPSC